MALLQLDSKVPISDTIRPACLPDDPEEDFGYMAGIITGWGYTEETKTIKPRPLTSSVLMEAEIYILPPVHYSTRKLATLQYFILQALCVEYSPFPITEKMVCTFKGPLGVETTCQVK